MTECRASYCVAASPPVGGEPNPKARRALAAIYGQVTEDELLRWVVGLARTYGLLCYHTHWAIKSQAGFPDVVLVPDPDRWSPEVLGARKLRGGPLLRLFELKTERGRLSPAQFVWGRALTTMQALAPAVIEYRVVRPSDKAEIEAALIRTVRAEEDEPCN